MPGPADKDDDLQFIGEYTVPQNGSSIKCSFTKYFSDDNLNVNSTVQQSFH